MNDDPSWFEAAARRWVALLNGVRGASDVAAALSDDIHIDRFGFGPNQGRLVERIRGTEHVLRWVEITPPQARFELAGAVRVDPTADGPTGKARYRITSTDFENFGWWTFRLAEDGRVRWLAHAPEDVEGAHLEGQHEADWRDLLIGEDGLPR